MPSPQNSNADRRRVMAVDPRQWYVPAALLVLIVPAVWFASRESGRVTDAIERLETAVTKLSTVIQDDVALKSDVRYVLRVLDEDNPNLKVADHLMESFR